MTADRYDGNEAQSRVIAKQLFSAWSAEQEGRQRRWLNGSVPAWTACLVSLATLIWGAAVLASDVSENRRRIEAVEADKVAERLARIETKLDQLMADREERNAKP